MIVDGRVAEADGFQFAEVEGSASHDIVGGWRLDAGITWKQVESRQIRMGYLSC